MRIITTITTICVLLSSVSLTFARHGPKPDCSQLEDGTYIADSLSAKHYYICRHGRARLNSCGRDSVFDSDSQSCIIKGYIDAQPFPLIIPTTTVCEEETTTAACEEETTTPPCDVSTTTSKTTKTTTTKTTTTKTTTTKAATTPPCAEETTTPPCVEETTTPPCEAETTTTTKTTTTKTTTTKTTTTKTTTPKAETTPPCAEETTTPPCAEETTTPPCVEETTTPPCAEETTTPPCAEETTTTTCTEKTTTSISIAPGLVPDIPETIKHFLNATSTCKKLPNGIVLLDPRHCRRFYVCVNGKAKLNKCARGNWYDYETKSCRQKADVTNCDANCN